MIYKRTILENGLRVLTIPMRSFESATALVLVGAGSRYEDKTNSGISHFLEHMAFKGTKTRPTTLSIANLVDGIGGEFNAYTGKESTGYYIKSAANNIELSIDILADMLQNSLLDQKEIDKEKGVILEEINLYEDTPSRKIGEVYEELLYGDTPLGWDIAGNKKVIKGVKRKDFVDYMKSLYSADNITVVIAGGVEEKTATELVQKYFGKMPKFDTIKYSPVLESRSKPAVLIRQKKTEQVHIALGVRTVADEHKDHYPLEVLAAIVGGGMSSRLFTEVREKRGLAYYVRSYSEHYTDCGSFVTLAGVDAKRADEAVKVIVEQYREIANGSQIEATELKKAKEFLKGHFVLELEDSRSVAGWYASQELFNKKMYNPDDILAKIDAVTAEEVKAVAQEYLVRPLNLAIIGDFKDKKPFEKILS
ncbi:MAG: insulinase family protein [Candidatus Levybacteria bacterium]|nr:insulinase family protein [Candidatus Levybacteria bacterium]